MSSGRFNFLFRVVCVFASFGFATAVQAADSRFLPGLTAGNKTAVGLAKLSSTQTTALDALIQRDIKSAREGDVVAFASTFSQRRTPQERANSGLDLLSDAERAKLDELVAREIANRPIPVGPLVMPRSSAIGNVETYSVKPEIHGSVTLTYGAGSHGSSFYGGEMDMNYTDPSGKFRADFSYAEIHGRGLGYFYGPDGRCW